MVSFGIILSWYQVSNVRDNGCRDTMILLLMSSFVGGNGDINSAKKEN